jgi:hypothetical protein
MIIGGVGFGEIDDHGTDFASLYFFLDVRYSAPLPLSL